MSRVYRNQKTRCRLELSGGSVVLICGMTLRMCHKKPKTFVLWRWEGDGQRRMRESPVFLLQGHPFIRVGHEHRTIALDNLRIGA